VRLDFQHAERVLQAARSYHSSSHPSSSHHSETALELPGGWRGHIRGRELGFEQTPPSEQEPGLAANGYEQTLSIPGEVEVRQLGLRFKALLLPGGTARGGYNPDQFLDRRNLAAPLTLRNWRPGDRFWPVHSKAPKKVKELLAGRHIAQPERALWPVAVSGGEIVWMRGFPAARAFVADAGAEAVVIGEEPLA